MIYSMYVLIYSTKPYNNNASSTKY